MVSPRLLVLHSNFMRVVQSYQPPSSRTIRSLSRGVSSPHTGVYTSRQHIQKIYQQYYCPASNQILQPYGPLKDGSSNNIEEVTLPVNGDTNSSQSNNSSPEQRPQGMIRRTTDAFSMPFDNLAVTNWKQGDLLVNWEHQEVHEVDNDGVEDTTAYPGRSGCIENKKVQMLPFPNLGAFDNTIHQPILPHGLATSDNTLPHQTLIPNQYYFDTYFLVRDISKAGFTDEQSITIMEAIQNILQKNTDFAKQCLICKSAVDKEVYLFMAACSEPRSSLQIAYNLETKRQHASRVQLEQECDILSQRLTQEIAGMKDGIKGKLNDQSITAREHQRSIDTLLQELNYKISVTQQRWKGCDREHQMDFDTSRCPDCYNLRLDDRPLPQVLFYPRARVSKKSKRVTINCKADPQTKCACAKRLQDGNNYLTLWHLSVAYCIELKHT